MRKNHTIGYIAHFIIRTYLCAPGSYGLPKPWYFPLTASYWCGHHPHADTVHAPRTTWRQLLPWQRRRHAQYGELTTDEEEAGGAMGGGDEGKSAGGAEGSRAGQLILSGACG